MVEQRVILVNEQDEPTGEMEKIEAHKKGELHRAFSIFIFNRKGAMLLQQRALNKYHSAGLWTNACCSHPQPGEETINAALRRLNEEMGFQTALEKVFSFVYKASFENGLTEYEFDHVFAGEFEGPVISNKQEVNEFCFKSMQEIKESLKIQPRHYTTWFQLAFPKIEAYWKEKYAEQLR